MKRAAALLLLLAGCQDFEPADEESPVPDIRVVAVLPIADQTGGSGFDPDEFANIVASELVRVHGLRVVRPARIRAAAESEIVTADDAIRIGRKVRADAVLACAITEYDPYDPPKVAVSIQILRTESAPMSGRDLDRMLQSASWRRGPLAMSRDRAGHVLAAYEEVFDSRDQATRQELRAYVRGRVESEREVLAVQSRYLQFVSTRMVTRAFANGS